MPDKMNLEWDNKWASFALANSSSPVLWLTPEARIIKSNFALESSLDYDAEALQSLTLFDLDEQLTKKNWKALWVKLSSQKSLQTESELNNKDGKVIFVELNFTLIEGDGFNLCCVLVKNIFKQKDLTTKLDEANLLLEMIVKERSESSKRTIDALQTRQVAFDKIKKIERRNQLILDFAGEGIYGLDNQGHTTFVNKAAAKMVGWELKDLVGKNQHDILHHTKPDGTFYDAKGCPIYAAFKDGKVRTVDDEVFWRKDGTSFPVEYTSTPIKDDNGKLLGAVVVFKDITKRKEAEQILQKTNVDLQDALSEVEQLKVRLEAENK